MKKLITTVLMLTVIGLWATGASATEYVAGGFEAAGNVVAGVGYQHQNNRAATEFAIDDQEGSFAGPIGRYVPAMGPRQDRFEFFVDSVELDLMKSFGENIRLRADLDFGRFNSGSNFGAFALEQAYATANIPWGNGLEVLFGRFNVPIGFEAVDVVNNDTISKSILIRSGMRPTNSTGLKLYYAFSDLVDWHVYFVNRLTRDNMRAKINDIPTVGMRLGFNWGEQGSESTVGISGFMGLENDSNSKKGWSYGGDIDVSWWVIEDFQIGLEALYRRDNGTVGLLAVPGVVQPNMWSLGILANFKYMFSDTWSGTAKYAMAHQNQATNGQWDFIGGTGLVGKQTVHEISLAANYLIADGATLKLEGRGDIILPLRGTPGRTQYVYGGAIAFAYEF